MKVFPVGRNRRYSTEAWPSAGCTCAGSESSSDAEGGCYLRAYLEHGKWFDSESRCAGTSKLAMHAGSRADNAVCNQAALKKTCEPKGGMISKNHLLGSRKHVAFKRLICQNFGPSEMAVSFGCGKGWWTMPGFCWCSEAEACSACVAVLPFLLDAEKSHGFGRWWHRGWDWKVRQVRVDVEMLGMSGCKPSVLLAAQLLLRNASAYALVQALRRSAARSSESPVNLMAIWWEEMTETLGEGWSLVPPCGRSNFQLPGYVFQNLRR